MIQKYWMFVIPEKSGDDNSIITTDNPCQTAGSREKAHLFKQNENILKYIFVIHSKKMYLLRNFLLIDNLLKYINAPQGVSSVLIQASVFSREARVLLFV